MRLTVVCALTFCGLAASGCQRPATTVAAPAPAVAHAWYPLVAEATWVYRADGVAGEEVRHVSRLASIDGGIAACLTTSARYDIPPVWAIVGDDGVRLLSGDAETVPAPALVAAAPLWLPGSESLAIGRSWVYQGVIPFALGHADDPALSGSPPSMSGIFTVTAREQQAVPAGQFDCLRVEAETQYDLGQPMTAHDTYWYATGVGLVRHRTAVEGAPPVDWQLVRHEGLTP